MGTSEHAEEEDVKLSDGVCDQNCEQRDINHNTTVNTKDYNAKVTDVVGDKVCCSTPKHILAKTFSFLSSTSSSARATSTSGDDTVFISGVYYDELGTAIGLFRDYVISRLRRSGFGYRIYITDISPAKDQDLSSRIISSGRVFETLHPTLFKNLSRKIGCVFDSPATIRRLYFRLATHIMGVDRQNFTWGRVLALFCLAGAMAVDCVSQGHPELVEELVKISGDFVKQNLLEWVIRHGGWVAMASHFTRGHASQYNFSFITNLKDSTLPMTVGFFGLSVLGVIGIHLLV